MEIKQTKLAAAMATPQHDGEKGLFPNLLHDLLDEAEKNEESDIVSWRSGGRCFKVHDKERFMKLILPRYFRLSQYKSFVRQLNIWGFVCIGQGPEKGAYRHKLFIRGQRGLTSGMTREKIKSKPKSVKREMIQASSEMQALPRNDSIQYPGGTVPVEFQSLPILNNNFAPMLGPSSRLLPPPPEVLPYSYTTQNEAPRLSNLQNSFGASFGPADRIPTHNQPGQPTMVTKEDWLSSLEKTFESAASNSSQHKLIPNSAGPVNPRPELNANMNAAALPNSYLQYPSDIFEPRPIGYTTSHPDTGSSHPNTDDERIQPKLHGPL